MNVLKQNPQKKIPLSFYTFHFPAISHGKKKGMLSLVIRGRDAVLTALTAVGSLEYQ